MGARGAMRGSGPAAAPRAAAAAAAAVACVVPCGAAPAQLSLRGRRGFLDAGDAGQVHYVYGGAAGSPPTVMLHGNPRSTLEFVTLAPLLGANRSWSALDFPGQGVSDDPAPAANLSAARLAAVTFGVTAAAGQRGPVAVLASLMGAYVGVEMAAAHPGRVSHLVLFNPNWWKPEVRAEVEWYMRTCPSVPELVANGSHLLAAWEQRSMQPWRDLAVQESKTVDRLRAGCGAGLIGMGLAASATLLEQLQALRVPVLFVWGQTYLDDGAEKGNATDNRAMRRLIEHAAGPAMWGSVEVPGGNEAMIEQNATFIAPHIHAFLA